MVYNVSPNSSRPTHHIKLSKDGKEIGLILCDARGNADAKGLARQNYPNSALKIYQGQETYADTEPPYKQSSQEDWSGGRGSKTFEKDSRRYNDSKRANTMRAGKILPGPREYWSNGYSGGYQQLITGNMNWYSLIGAGDKVQYKITMASTITADKIQIYARKEGTPLGNLTLEIRDDNAGVPGTLLKTITRSLDEDLSNFYTFDWSGTQSLTSGTYYWIVVMPTVDGTSTNHYEIGGNGTNSYLFYRITGAQSACSWRHFEYKRALYALQLFDDGSTASVLWLNGDRGTADSNAANKDRLVDATKTTWGTGGEVWTGAVAMVIKGPGSEEPQPWRNITGTYNGYCTVSPNWNVTHTTETEYVIVGADYWKSLASTTPLGGHVTDVAITDEFVYFARGETAALNILRYEEYNQAGVWTARSGAEQIQAHLLLATRHPTEGAILWGSQNANPQHGTCVFKAKVPPAWGLLYSDLENELIATDEPWDDLAITNITHNTDEGSTKIAIGAGFTTGTIAVKNLDAPVNVMKAKRLGVLAKSSVVTTATNLRFLVDDVLNLGVGIMTPVAVHYYDNATGGTPANAFVSATAATAPCTFPPLMYDGFGSGTGHISTVTYDDTADVIWIGGAEPFDTIYWTLGTSVNNNAAVLLLNYYNGGIVSPLTVTADNTASPAGTPLAKASETNTMTFTIPQDWTESTVNGVTGYWVTVRFGSALDAVSVCEIQLSRTNNDTWFLPALDPANEWHWCIVAINPNSYPPPDWSALQSIGLTLDTDLGAQTIYLYGGLKMLKDSVDYIRLPAETRITGLEAYAKEVGETEEVPWVFTENGPPYKLVDEEGQLAAIPIQLREIRSMRSEKNGKAHTVGGVYLYFNMGEKIERYYNGQLDDVGPDLGEGLPSARRGDIVKLLSYPGAVLAAIDAGSSYTSSVLIYNNDGWHEYYRATKGARVRDLFIQTIPGKVDRLWVSNGVDIVWLPISVNPEQDSTYGWTHESVVYTSRITAGMQDVEKFWRSLKIASEGLVDPLESSANVQLYVDYRVDGDTSWTPLPEVFTISPFQEVPLSADYSVAGNWIEFRLRIVSNYSNYFCRILGLIVKSIERQEVKEAYNLTFRLRDNDVDLQGGQDPIASYKDKLDQLDAWVGVSTPIYMEGIGEMENGKYVFLEPIPARRLAIIVEPDGHTETHVFQMTVLVV